MKMTPCIEVSCFGYNINFPNNICYLRIMKFSNINMGTPIAITKSFIILHCIEK